jgi:hypothetical protein
MSTQVPLAVQAPLVSPVPVQVPDQVPPQVALALHYIPVANKEQKKWLSVQ